MLFDIYVSKGAEIGSRNQQLFSLAPGSPSLGGYPADIFLTDFTGNFSLFAPAGALGLLPEDNLDAMDCQVLVDSDIPDAVDPVPQGQIPGDFRLYPNFPNPFNASTTITFDLPVQSQVTLTIYNELGETVVILADQMLPSGQYRTVWDASGVTSGVYFYSLEAGIFVETRKLYLAQIVSTSVVVIFFELVLDHLSKQYYDFTAHKRGIHRDINLIQNKNTFNGCETGVTIIIWNYLFYYFIL